MHDGMPPADMPEMDEEQDARARLCLQFSALPAARVAMLADVEASHDEIAGHYQARLMEMSQVERQVISGINDSLPTNAHVVPFSLLPPAIWESGLEAQLMAWGLVTIHPYLNMYLPGNESGNAVLYLPAAPATYPDSYTEGAVREVRNIAARYEQACGPAPAAGADEAALEDWLEREEAARLDAVEEVLMLAEFLARRLFGNEIVERHEGLFGKIMKEAMGFPSGLMLEKV
jgi:hypothetical protein